MTLGLSAMLHRGIMQYPLVKRNEHTSHQPGGDLSVRRRIDTKAERLL